MQKLANFAKNEERIKSVNLTGLASAEVFQIRPFLTGALNHWYRMSVLPSEMARGPGGGRAAAGGRSRFAGARGTETASSSSGGGDGGGGGETPGDQVPASSRKLRRHR